jgi:hypothetical protein
MAAPGVPEAVTEELGRFPHEVQRGGRVFGA